MGNTEEFLKCLKTYNSYIYFLECKVFWEIIVLTSSLSCQSSSTSGYILLELYIAVHRHTFQCHLQQTVCFTDKHPHHELVYKYDNKKHIVALNLTDVSLRHHEMSQVHTEITATAWFQRRCRKCSIHRRSMCPRLWFIR